MPLWQRMKALWRNLAHRRAVDDDLDSELRSYREMLEAEGVTRREALIEMGGTEQIKEAVRDERTGATLQGVASELRQSARALRRNPGLAIGGTLMLALGIGAATIVFSVFHAALLQPLPFRDAGRVVEVFETRLDRGMKQISFSQANFWDMRSQNRVFEETGAYHFGEGNLTGNGPAVKVTAISVTAGFFRALGASPVIGRDFDYSEVSGGTGNSGGGSGVVILGNRFWKSRFGGDPSVLGKTLRLDGKSYTVIGVMPHGQPWLNRQLYLPFGYRPDANRGSWEYSAVARLRPGVTIDAAKADLQRIAEGLKVAYPRDDKGIGFGMLPSSSWVATDDTRRALWVLLGAVTFLLLIACLNIANLLLARGTARHREIAIRAALGAGRGRIVRYVMMESLLLSGAGTLCGLMLAYGGLGALQTLESTGIPRLRDATLNPWVLGFAVLISLLTGVLSGLAPALQAPSSGISNALRDGDRGQTGSSRQNRVRAILVTGEVALSFLLLVGAGLLIRSFTQLMNVDRGFQTDHRVVFSINVPDSYYRDGAGKQFMDRLFERLNALPEVVAAGAVYPRPVEGGDPGMGIDSNFRQAKSGYLGPPWAGWRIITPGYFRAVGLRIVNGRGFTEQDLPVWKEKGQPEPARHVVISERLARLLFPNENPVGQHVALWKGQSSLDAEVVGVAANSRERGLSSDPSLTVYLPSGRIALPTDFVVSTRTNSLALMPSVRSIVAGLDPDLPISDVRTFEEVVDSSVAPQRLNATLLAIFSGLALLLATTGIYGVLAYTMTRRTAEIGLRVALGASGGSILRMTLGQGMRPVLFGLVAGGLGAWWLSRYFAALLFGVKVFDPMTYAGVAVLLTIAALAACYIPGLRAMRTDPVVALRAE